MNTKHTLKFECTECCEEFSVVIEYPIGIFNRIIDILNNIFAVGSRKVLERAFTIFEEEVKEHRDADSSIHEIGFFYMKPIDPPSWLRFGCNKCSWHTKVGDKSDEELENELFDHVNKHEIGKKNIVISPFILI
jgi:hypothetical protein